MFADSSDAFQYYVHASLHEHTSFCLLSNLSESERGSLDRLINATCAGVMDKEPNEEHVRKLHTLQFSLPWPEKAALSFFNKFIDLLGINRIRTAIESAQKELMDLPSVHSTTDALNIIAHGNTYIAKVLSLLEDDPSYMYSEWERTMRPQALRSFLTDSCSRPTLDKLAIARNLTLEDRYMLLQSLWECLIGPVPTLTLDQHTRLWIWIDELENILDYTEKEQRESVKGLKYLIASTSNFLTICFNISAQSDEHVRKIKTLLGTMILPLIDEDLTGIHL